MAGKKKGKRKKVFKEGVPKDFVKEATMIYDRVGMKFIEGKKRSSGASVRSKKSRGWRRSEGSTPVKRHIARAARKYSLESTGE